MTSDANQPTDPLGALTLADFEPLLETDFRLHLEGADEIVLRLAKATDLAIEGRPHGPRRPFSLIFHGPAELRLPQAAYLFEHPELPSLRIFIVPLGPRDGVERYQAVFH